MTDREQRIRERAFEIWVSEGCPKDREIENWRQAEREVAIQEAAMGDEKAGIGSGRNYDRRVEEFEKSGRVEPAAKEARRAVDGPEEKELKRAEQAGKHRGKEDDLGGKR